MTEWFQAHLGWMYWTVPSAMLFAILICAIIGMGIWDRISPGYARRGFLPLLTTRGDRFFIGVMTLVGIYLVWLAFLGTSHLWAPLAIAAAMFAAIIRWA